MPSAALADCGDTAAPALAEHGKGCEVLQKAEAAVAEGDDQAGGPAAAIRRLSAASVSGPTRRRRLA